MVREFGRLDDEGYDGRLDEAVGLSRPRICIAWRMVLWSFVLPLSFHKMFSQLLPDGTGTFVPANSHRTAMAITAILASIPADSSG